MMRLLDIGTVAAETINMDRVRRQTEAIHAIECTYRARDFERSGRLVEQLLRETGFEQIRRYALPMDGTTSFMDCTMPQSWDIEPGSGCWLTDPAIPEEQRVIVDYSADHFGCGIWSAPTPPEGLDAELIDSQNITENTDLSNKFILATEKAAVWYRYGCMHGAAGILMYDGAPMAAAKFPDNRRWGNGISLFGWYHVKNDPRLIIYHITPRQGNFLHEQLKNGPLHLHAVMNSKIFDGKLWTVTGVIPGESGEEIVLLAHLYEPFLSDDAIGASSSIEICRVLRELSLSGRIGKLQKTLRVVFSMELYGFSEFFTHEEQIRRTMYAVNLDAIGNFNTQSPEERSTVNIRQTAGAAPFISDLLYRQYFREADTVRISENRGCLSDDTFCSDPMIRRICGHEVEAEKGIPVNWLRTCILPYHHNTNPMYAQVDYRLAGEIIKAHCAVLGVLASADRKTLSGMRSILTDLAGQELNERMQQAYRQSETGELSAAAAYEMTAYWRQLEKRRLLSVNDVIPGFWTENEIERCLPVLPEKQTADLSLSEMEKQAAEIRVTRLTPGLLESQVKIPAWQEKVRGPAIPDFPVLLSFLDGKRDLLTVLRMTAYDQSGKMFTDQQIRDLIDYLYKMAEHGYFRIDTI